MLPQHHDEHRTGKVSRNCESARIVAVQFVADVVDKGAKAIHQRLFLGMENNHLGQRYDQQILRSFLEMQLTTDHLGGDLYA
jgi:hypothetical protein